MNTQSISGLSAGGGWTRRGVLRAIAVPLGVLALPLSVMAQRPMRIAAIDWAMLETLIALGIAPVAATELKQFRKTAVEPVLPQTVADLGLRGSPNLELLHLLRPDLILTSPFYARRQSEFETVAPVLSLPFYVPGELPFEKSLEALAALGERLEMVDAARIVCASALVLLAQARQRLAGFQQRPTYVIGIGDARHFRAFGQDSMFGDVLNRLGLPNAWGEATQFSFAAPVPLERLADRPDARIVVVGDIPVEARGALSGSVLWKALPAVRERRLVQTANVNPYGGVLAGLRFAHLLEEALRGQEEQL